jgi:hypothetical protein
LLLQDRIHKSVLADDLDTFRSCLAELESDAHRHVAIIHALYAIVLHDSILIFDYVMNMAEVNEHILYTTICRDTLFTTAINNGKNKILDRIHTLQIFRDYVAANPYEVIVGSTKGRAADQLNKMLLLTGIGDCVAAWDNQAFISARVNYNDAAANRLLEFPDVFDFVDSGYDEQHTTGDCISIFLAYYFPALEQRQKDFKRNNPHLTFDVDTREAELGRLIIRHLLRKYAADTSNLRPARASMLTRAIQTMRFMRDSFSVTGNDKQLQQITQLLKLPGVQAIAAANDNELLRRALILGQRDAIVTKLRAIESVRVYELANPIDLAYARVNILSLEEQYRATHPRAEVLAYEANHPRAIFGQAMDLQSDKRSMVDLENNKLRADRERLFAGLSDEQISALSDQRCPMSLTTMVNPVRIKGQPTNHVFERAYLIEWILFRSATSPLTRDPCTIDDIEPADDIALAISQKIDQVHSAYRPRSVA